MGGNDEARSESAAAVFLSLAYHRWCNENQNSSSTVEPYDAMMVIMILRLLLLT